MELECKYVLSIQNKFSKGIMPKPCSLKRHFILISTKLDFIALLISA